MRKPARVATRPPRSPHDVHHQAAAAPPIPDGQQSRLHAARLRGQGLHPVRGLWSRLHIGRNRPGLLGTGHRAAPGCQTVGHWLQFQDAGLFSRSIAWLQHRAWTYALGADRCQSGQSRFVVPGCVRRWRFGLDRPGAVRAQHAARRPHGLYRGEQRCLRLDQRAVFGHRRPGFQEQEGCGQQRQRG